MPFFQAAHEDKNLAYAAVRGVNLSNKQGCASNGVSLVPHSSDTPHIPRAVTMKRIFLFSLLLICLPLPAFAYIDPGTGSAIISMIIGAFVAAGVVIKSYWYRLKMFIQNKRSPHSREDDSSPPR